LLTFASFSQDVKEVEAPLKKAKVEKELGGACPFAFVSLFSTSRGCRQTFVLVSDLPFLHSLILELLNGLSSCNIMILSGVFGVFTGFFKKFLSSKTYVEPMDADDSELKETGAEVLFLSLWVCGSVALWIIKAFNLFL